MMKKLTLTSARQSGREFRDDAGLSLSELLVSILLLGIVMTIVTSLFVSTNRTVATGKGIADNTKTASNGMNEVARVIRAGTDNPVSGSALSDPAFVTAENEAIVIYAYVNLDSAAERPVMIRLALDSSRNLIESRWPATLLTNGNWSFPSPSTAPTSTRILGGTVATRVSGQPWVFTYLTAAGDTLPVPATGALTAAQLRTIAAVRVTLTIQASQTNSKNAVTLTNAVGIPNLGIPRTVVP